MPKCDACGSDELLREGCSAGMLCIVCLGSWQRFPGSVFDWCIARHAELQGKQAKKLSSEQIDGLFNGERPAQRPSPTDAELIAQAITSGSSLVALAALSYADAVGNEDESTKALRAALKSRGVIK